MKSIVLILGIVLVLSCKDSPKVKQETEVNTIGESKNNNGTETDPEINDTNFLEKGKLYTQSTQKILVKNLMLNLQKNGAVAAVEFCNERAYPLTDSMAIIYNAKIRRVTDKPRNLENQANGKELEYIEFF
ncbi:hypothetical protein [Maribacter arcticus]|uniref:hypothetical protein n=1 Tax=Maribacter arcticus TaxID=561365 RepID=UPI003001FDB7